MATIGEVQAPELPTWPMFLIMIAKSKVFISPSLFKSAFSFQLGELEVVLMALRAME